MDKLNLIVVDGPSMKVNITASPVIKLTFEGGQSVTLKRQEGPVMKLSVMEPPLLKFNIGKTLYIYSTSFVNLTGNPADNDALRNYLESFNFENITLDPPLVKLPANHYGFSYNSDHFEIVNGAIQIKTGVVAPASHTHPISQVENLQGILDSKVDSTYVQAAIANLVNSSPSTLDTLKELADALGDDPNFATTVTNQIATKLSVTDPRITNWDTAFGWGNHSGLYKALDWFPTWNEVASKPEWIQHISYNSLSGRIEVDCDFHVTGNITAAQSIIGLIQSAVESSIFNNLGFEYPVYKPAPDRIGLKYNTTQFEVNGSHELQIKSGVLAPAAHNHSIVQIDGLQAALDLKASISYVDNKVAALVNSSPATLDTLNELAAALGNDPNFATTTANLIGTKLSGSDPRIAGWDQAYAYSQIGHLPLNGGTMLGSLKITGTNKLKLGTVSSDDYQSISGTEGGGDMNFRTYSDYVFYTGTGNGTNGTEKIRFTQAGVIQAVGGNSTNWNAAYGWGNHAGRYLPLSGGTVTGAINYVPTIDGTAPTPAYEDLFVYSRYGLSARIQGGNTFVSNGNTFLKFVASCSHFEGNVVVDYNNDEPITINDTRTNADLRTFYNKIQFKSWGNSLSGWIGQTHNESFGAGLRGISLGVDTEEYMRINWFGDEYHFKNIPTGNTPGTGIIFKNTYGSKYDIAKIQTGTGVNYYDGYISFLTNDYGYAGVLSERGRFDYEGLDLNGSLKTNKSIILKSSSGVTKWTLSLGAGDRLEIKNAAGEVVSVFQQDKKLRSADSIIGLETL